MHENQRLSNYNSGFSFHVFTAGQIYVANRGLEHINCIIPASSGKGALFMGDVVCTLKLDILTKYQIKSVLTCMIEQVSPIHNSVLAHKVLPIRDSLDFPISQYFKQAIQFINDERSKNRNTLVHCHAGVSRSAAIVCSYLMLEQKWNVQTALQFLIQKRYRAKPNENFIKQLKILEQKQIKYFESSQAQKLEKNITIKLEQEVQTHDELLYLERKKNLFFVNKIFSFANQEGQFSQVLNRNLNSSNIQISIKNPEKTSLKPEKFFKQPEKQTLQLSNTNPFQNGQICLKRVCEPKNDQNSVRENNSYFQKKKNVFAKNQNHGSATVKSMSVKQNNSLTFLDQNLQALKRQSGQISKPFKSVMINHGQKLNKNNFQLNFAGQKNFYKLG